MLPKILTLTLTTILILTQIYPITTNRLPRYKTYNTKRYTPNTIDLMAFPTSTNLKDWFREINQNVSTYNSKGAEISWQMAVDSHNPELELVAGDYAESRSRWYQSTCNQMEHVSLFYLNETQKRQAYLLCREPRFEDKETGPLIEIFGRLQTLYADSKVCLPKISNPQNAEKDPMENTISTYLADIKKRLKAEGLFDESLLVELAVQNSLKIRNDSKSNVVCYVGEPDLERLMIRSRNEEVLRWSWLVWREMIGPRMRPLYKQMVELENLGAKRNGYSDLGAWWREELEMPNIEEVVENLFDEIRPLYTLLHGVARYFLRLFYGDHIVPRRGPIPAHILGNMWSQNWASILNLILPTSQYLDLDKSIKQTGWTTIDMVKRTEDFYISLGFPPMTDLFWKHSVFGEGGNVSDLARTSRCHGSAANMFKHNDFRIIYCAQLTLEDFYVIHHEMGHIQYYMAYQRQPAIFQEGTNSGFQESIGDTIMNAVLTPQHLYRLALINDTDLFSTNPRRTVRNGAPVNPRKMFTTEKGDRTDTYKFVKRRSTRTTVPFYDLDVDHDFGANQGLNKEETNIQETQKPKDDKTGKQKDFSETTRTVNTKRDWNLNFDDILLLRQALTKLPQIPFSLLIDKYRWKIFNGEVTEQDYNTAFWEMARKYQGVMAPKGGTRGEKYLDAGSKFHVPDNTPYIRYFFSSFLQMQLFKGMCTLSVYGKNGVREHQPLPTHLPLHRCDIYGSKMAGSKLKEMMSKGSSRHWSEALDMVTGSTEISAQPLLEYFEPLRPLLDKLVSENNIPLGW